MKTESNSNAQPVPPVAEVNQPSIAAASDAIPAQDLTPPQLDEIKGGPGLMLQHNETVTSDSDIDDSTASVDTVDTTPAQDLTPTQLDTINGGGPGVVIQHNETTASDSDADEPAPAASVDPVDAIPAQDLTPPQLDTIKGGPDFSILLNGGGLKFNHNETAASDETQAA